MTLDSYVAHDAPASDGNGCPLIVGIGGTLRPDSTGARALRLCLDHAKQGGAQTEIFTGDALRMPLYDPIAPISDPTVENLVRSLRAADGIVIASPGYHGSISGTLKNALDYTEAMKGDVRSYFDGRAVGCIGAAAGWQAANATLLALRSIVHALRGWPTPLGITLNSSERLFDEDGNCVDPAVLSGLTTMTDQVLHFARLQRADRSRIAA